LPAPQEDIGVENLQQHIAARNRLKMSVTKADRFVQNLHRQPWFEELFPHVE
jgi:hypothetical protein